MPRNGDQPRHVSLGPAFLDSRRGDTTTTLKSSPTTSGIARPCPSSRATTIPSLEPSTLWRVGLISFRTLIWKAARAPCDVTRDVRRAQSKDILQFCSNRFQARLEEKLAPAYAMPPRVVPLSPCRTSPQSLLSTCFWDQQPPERLAVLTSPPSFLTTTAPRFTSTRTARLVRSTCQATPSLHKTGRTRWKPVSRGS